MFILVGTLYATLRVMHVTCSRRVGNAEREQRGCDAEHRNQEMSSASQDGLKCTQGRKMGKIIVASCMTTRGGRAYPQAIGQAFCAEV